MSVKLNQLDQWKQYLDGTKCVIDTDETYGWELSKERNITSDALKQLSLLQDEWKEQANANKLTRTYVLQASELSNTIERVVTSIITYTKSYTGRQSCINDLDAGILSHLNTARKFMRDAIQTSQVEELQPKFVIEKLREFPDNLPAIEALVGKDGLFSLALFSQVLGIETKELLQRCLVNARLKTTADVITCLQNLKKDTNAITALKNYLDTSRQMARSVMSQSMRNVFDKQWNKLVQRDSISQNKIIPNIPSQKCEAWDFIKKAQLETEVTNADTMLQKMRLYTGGGEQFSLSYFFIENMAFWSSDSKNFYRMKEVKRANSEGSYCASFEIKNSSEIRLNVNSVYATALNNINEPVTTYERVNLKGVKSLYESFKSGEAQIFLNPFVE